jgi:hypothetical protein
MLSEDVDALIHFISSRCDLVVTQRYDDAPAINPTSDRSAARHLALWNRDLQPQLRRKRIQLDAGGERFVIRSEEQILELTNSVLTTWNGRPGLVHGRIYGSEFCDRPEYTKWFESIQRWIRKSFRKNPFSLGFVGPEAWTWFEEGGLLLPNFIPPVTSVWMTELEKQADWIRNYESLKSSGP